MVKDTQLVGKEDDRKKFERLKRLTKRAGKLFQMEIEDLICDEWIGLRLNEFQAVDKEGKTLCTFYHRLTTNELHKNEVTTDKGFCLNTGHIGIRNFHFVVTPGGETLFRVFYKVDSRSHDVERIEFQKTDGTFLEDEEGPIAWSSIHFLRKKGLWE